MAKRKRKRENMPSRKPILLRTAPSMQYQVNKIRQANEQKQERLLPLLEFDESLQNNVDNLFEFDNDDLQHGRETLVFATAIFTISSVQHVISEFEEKEDMTFEGKDENGYSYLWIRDTTDNKLSTVDAPSGTLRTLADIQVNNDNTLVLDAKTKNRLIDLMLYLFNFLDTDMKLIKLELQEVTDIFS